jgi:RNA polymerase sigma-70 factor (ECF subfamily)
LSVEFDLERFHSGDESLFTELVALHSPRLRRHLCHYSGPGVDDRDLLQEAWLRAFHKRHTFDGRGSFIGWLLMVGRTVGLAAVRKRARDLATATLTDVAGQAGSTPDPVLEAVLALPERQRDVLLLRLVEGLSVAETARRMRCAEGTVKATLHQATRKLREQLKEVGT